MRDEIVLLKAAARDALLFHFCCTYLCFLPLYTKMLWVVLDVKMRFIT